MKTHSQTKQSNNTTHLSKKRQKKTTPTQTLSREVVFALYCSASFPPILATARGSANRDPGSTLRASPPGYCSALPASNRAGRDPDRACGTSTAVHLLGMRTGFFRLLQHGLANNLEQIPPSLPPLPPFSDISRGGEGNLLNEVTERM